jgi:hypothetical protein
MQKLVSLAFAALPLTALSGEQLITTADGTSWRYEMTEEAGDEFTFSDLKAGPDGKVHLLAIYRISGTQEVEGKRLLKFEMHRDGVISNVDLITVDEHGIFCAARIDQFGELTRLDPPQTMMAAPLENGATWDFSGKLGDSDVHQHYEVVGEEDVVVPAGKFRAFHIHGEQIAPARMTIDRWFVNGVGIIKDVTEMRVLDGDLLRRISLELKEKPKIAPRPEVKPGQAIKSISASLGEAPIGEAAAEFKVETPKIYARWRGHRLRDHAEIRVVWIAEDIGEVAPRNYTIDEATATATSPEAHGNFTLSKPDDGWTPGSYRVEFYVDAKLAEIVKLKISK